MWARRSSPARGAERLAARRRLRRRRALVALAVLLLLVLAAAVYGLRQSAVRISQVTVFGADESFASYAIDAMRGTYFGVIPRNSTFFLPEGRIRSAILAAHPEVAAVSIFRSGFFGLSIKVDERTAVARWCGLAPTPGVEPYCYVFDPNGYVYAAAASSTPTLNPFPLYAPLANAALEPLGATLADADNLPATFDFARQLGTRGSPVTAVVIQNGEVNDYLASGTRITYVLGDEKNAYAALVSASADLNLSDGSLDYVDLRFDGKIYLKKKQAAASKP